MGLNNMNIRKTRIHIKNKIVHDHNLYNFKNERQQIYELLKRTIDTCESNSALLVGPRGVGKTILVNDILKELLNDKHFIKNAILVRLNGLVHTDDKLALRSITTQMNLDNAIDGKVFGSFAENLSFLLACLKTGRKDTSKSIIFVLEEFDLFCNHHNQTLLYNLFDVSQSDQTPICVFGITCRLDIIELFEKRVKSRFSHRQIFLFSKQSANNCKIKGVQDLLLLPKNSKNFTPDYIAQWNSDIKQLVNNELFQKVMKRLLDIDPCEKILRNILMIVISKLNDTKMSITAGDFEDELQAYEKDDLIYIIRDLNILELCLIIAMKHHSNIYDAQPFNFEMIVTRYNKFVNSNSNLQGVQRTVALKAFEHIQNMELITAVSTIGNKLQLEYQLFKLMVTSQQIMEAIKHLQGLPTEVVQWANSSIV